jgi:hypothetical protein
VNTPQQVRQWSERYPVVYDEQHYDPNIAAARRGDPTALRLVTQWKNPGRGNPPTAMRLARTKEVPFQRFLGGLGRYLAPGGSAALRADFPVTSPVYAIFWHHVLFGSPVFDVHTHRAFHHFTQGPILPGRTAAIPRGGHWQLYDRYTAWFRQTLAHLQEQDPIITERQLDRALMQWGIAHKK